MKRRSILKTLTVATGTGLILPATFFAGCKTDQYQPIFFTLQNLSLLNEIGETILPETSDAPGAKSLKVANFMDKYVNDCISEDKKAIIQNGLRQFTQFCQTSFKQSFLKMTQEERHDCLVQLNKIAKDQGSDHYFSIVKNLIIFTYFTSKEGMEKALNYLPVPGKYIGNYHIHSSSKAWAL